MTISFIDYSKGECKGMPYAPGIEATRIPSLVPAAFPHRDAKIRSRLKFIAIRKRQIRDRSLDLACRLSHSALRRALHASIALQETAVFLAIIFNEKSIDCDLDAVSLRGGRVSAKPVSSKRTSNSGNPLATSRKNKSKPLLKTGFLAPVQISAPPEQEKFVP